MTLAMPKIGLMSPYVREYINALYLANISLPPVLYRTMGLEVGKPFEKDSIIKIRESHYG